MPCTRGFRRLMSGNIKQNPCECKGFGCSIIPSFDKWFHQYKSSAIIAVIAGNQRKYWGTSQFHDLAVIFFAVLLCCFTIFHIRCEGNRDMCNPCLFAFLPTYHFPSTKLGNPHFYLNRFNIKIARNGFIDRQNSNCTVRQGGVSASI